MAKIRSSSQYEKINDLELMMKKDSVKKQSIEAYEEHAAVLSREENKRIGKRHHVSVLIDDNDWEYIRTYCYMHKISKNKFYKILLDNFRRTQLDKEYESL